jgi:uncharacterized lipoprotein YmbA
MKRLLPVLFVSAATALAACGLLDPRPDVSRFFVLAWLGDLGSPIEACALPDGTRVGLGPVRLPEYLEQPALLTRTSPTEIRPSLTDRWSEPLDTMLPRVLGDDLSQIFRSQNIVMFPWYSTARPEWQIEIDIVRFEPNAAGEVSLIAQWRVHELGAGGRSRAAESRIMQQASSTDPAQRAQAMSTALGKLAEELAQALCQLAAK